MIPDLTKDSLMTFGQSFKGKMLKDVPAWYLLWIDKNYQLQPSLKKYINDHRKTLEEEKKMADKEMRR